MADNLSFLTALATAAPRWDAQLVLILTHVLLWGALDRAIRTHAPKALYRFAFYRQLKSDCWRLLPPGPVERGGFDTRYGYLAWIFIATHHVVAGGLILFSHATHPSDDGIFFRHGTLIALGGFDIMQSLQIVRKAPPFDEVPPQNAPTVDIPLLAHHLYGLLLIVPANMLLSTDKDVQIVAIAGLLASVVNVVLGLVNEVIDPLKRANRNHQRVCYVVFTILGLLNLSSFVYFRWWLFPKHSYAAFHTMYAIAPALGVLCGVATAFLFVFNVVVLATMLKVCVDLVVGGVVLFRDGPQKALESPETPTARALRRAQSSPIATGIARVSTAARKLRVSTPGPSSLARLPLALRTSAVTESAAALTVEDWRGRLAMAGT